MSTLDTALHCGPWITLAACLWLALAKGLDDRAIARHYAALATRWRQVENNANAYIAAAGNQLADRILQQIHTNDTHEGDRDR
ncbi:hypothetical protein [Streptomyces sp900116325]|uniref:hypothetical protein n=1 Tax=Streptomyces sp. 900116325 TaxID=3154295 RepID=UPI0033DDDF08